MRFIDFLFSKQFLKHLLLSIIIGNVLFWGSLFFLSFYTRHGEAIPVPDVRGLTIEEAAKKLQEKSFLFEITDSVFLTDKKKGAIVEQNPPADFKVKKGRKIFLTINSFFPERVKMPNVVGVSLRQARAVLETYGLKIGRTRYVPDIAKDNVLEQKFKGKKITEGTTIEKGSAIDLILGKGEKEEESDTSATNMKQPDEKNL
ncbi:MAG: PASTA domain-containing protein [Bacteroidia bacterium]|nr:PASTA domain-containing protein [Bacteroidia bacterium]